jgi:hypothetical protein
MTTMARYELRVDSGASRIVQADSVTDALLVAQDWVQDGDYAPEVRTVHVRVTAPDGDVSEHDVEAHGPA